MKGLTPSVHTCRFTGNRIRILREVDLNDGDVSIVTYPAYPQTSAEARAKVDELANSPGPDEVNDNNLVEERQRQARLAVRKRQIELEETLRNCEAKRIYISAFLDFREFKRHIGSIAWETEVWIEDNPDHIIHFDGSKFFTVYGD